jgi:hypothetical protein
VPVKTVPMVPNYRAAAKFVEKTRDLFAGMVYNVPGTAPGPQLDTEKLTGVLANMLDLGLGTTPNFGWAEQQISPRIWGNAA